VHQTGGAVVDSALGASAIPFTAGIIPLAALLFICRRSGGAALPRRFPLHG